MLKSLLSTLAVFALLSHSGQCQEMDTLVDVGGDRLHFHVVRVWDSLLAPIATITGATLITYDRAGFGKSEIDTAEHDLDKHGIVHGVESLEAGLSKLGYAGDVMLVAHSYGGLYAKLYATRHPTMVRAAVLQNPGSYYQSANLAKTVAIMSRAVFPSTHCHKQFAAAQPNREHITAYGTTHYIFRDNPPLVIHAIAKAYAGAVGEPEAGVIAERDLAYAIVAVNEMKRQQRR